MEDRPEEAEKLFRAAREFLEMLLTWDDIGEDERTEAERLIREMESPRTP